MRALFYIFIALFFLSCSKNIPNLNERVDKVLNYASLNNQEDIIIKTSYFNLFSLQKRDISCENKNLRVYIEGDGLSFISRREISNNPTPINSTILNLMQEDKNECKVYLARPCQYVDSFSCNKSYWTNKRFSIEVIESFNEALDLLKSIYKNKNFSLIGHSGGAAVATILTSKRYDVNNLVTIAGNLDIEKWVQIKNLSKLDGSLNPADFTFNLENIRQYHLIGLDDNIVPKDVFLSYLSRFEGKNNISYKYIKANHNCCYNESFIDILNNLE